MPTTPYLLVDAARMRLNIRRAAELARQAGVSLRPHVKTHKSPDIARIQLAAGATGITVATIGEAEVFAAHGFDDIFIAYPVWIDAPRARRLADLVGRGVRLAVGVDSVEAAGQAGRMLGGAHLAALVEVDCGQHRSGVDPAGAGSVAAAAQRGGLEVRGVFTFPGHSYAPGVADRAAQEESDALARAVGSLADEGITAAVVSGGSTPSLAHSDLSVLTELRPGVYAFGDAQQWELGVMSPERIALTCRTTVVSHAGGRLVLDAGSKILGADRASYATGHGRLPAHPDARIVQLSEHHCVVDLAGSARPDLGTVVDVVPNHVCSAINLVDLLHLDDATGPASWPVRARGHNS
ncbi:alanine racemase [Nocardioides sp.]|uniref:alanine racemase n=1 Tax=Nocardioides sp. TaxID=35761 RepID=UPI0027343E02|nr:alanine racemase [Nocardioides sp.]MDP3894170.1 alanine racemase [Nocardioides sp.]